MFPSITRAAPRVARVMTDRRVGVAVIEKRVVRPCGRAHEMVPLCEGLAQRFNGGVPKRALEGELSEDTMARHENLLVAMIGKARGRAAASRVRDCGAAV